MKELITETDKQTVESFTEHRAFKELGKNASNWEIVEAATTDLRERQYNASIASGSTPEEAAIESGWNPKA
jgi:hypothetical protein